jgi:hypothetical protein
MDADDADPIRTSRNRDEAHREIASVAVGHAVDVFIREVQYLLFVDDGPGAAPSACAVILTEPDEELTDP